MSDRLTRQLQEWLDGFESSLSPSVLIHMAIERIAELESSLRFANCPYPVLEDQSIGACIDAGKCGCCHGKTLKGNRTEGDSILEAELDRYGMSLGEKR